MTVADTLARVFRESLDLLQDAEVEGLEYRGISQWDSVGHMRLIAAIESEFDVMLETDDILDMSDFQKALEILAKNGVGIDA